MERSISSAQYSFFRVRCCDASLRETGFVFPDSLEAVAVLIDCHNDGNSLYKVIYSKVVPKSCRYECVSPGPKIVKQ